MSSVTLGAMNGLLESIDPYASYLNAEQYKDYLKNFDTYRGDLGMVLAKKFGYITVVSVIPGSPAAKAGLTTGDMLESIKGIATRDMPLAYANLLLRGQPGTTVDLSVLRRKPEPQKLTMTRAIITRARCRIEDVARWDRLHQDRDDGLRPGQRGQPPRSPICRSRARRSCILDLRYSASGRPKMASSWPICFWTKV